MKKDVQDVTIEVLGCNGESELLVRKVIEEQNEENEKRVAEFIEFALTDYVEKMNMSTKTIGQVTTRIFQSQYMLLKSSDDTNWLMLMNDGVFVGRMRSQLIQGVRYIVFDSFVTFAELAEDQRWYFVRYALEELLQTKPENRDVKRLFDKIKRVFESVDDEAFNIVVFIYEVPGGSSNIEAYGSIEETRDRMEELEAVFQDQKDKGLPPEQWIMTGERRYVREIDIRDKQQIVDTFNDLSGNINQLELKKACVDVLDLLLEQGDEFYNRNIEVLAPFAELLMEHPETA